MNFDLTNLVRINVQNLIPYSSARSENKKKEGIFLDANESPFESSFTSSSILNLKLNRYPDPEQLELKKTLGKLKGLQTKNIFLGNGSDEAIDLLFRAFCNPGKDNVIICPPTYGMYEVSANINDVDVIKVPLTPETFQLNEQKILQAISTNTKLLFICCPNNPTGNGVKWQAIKQILDNFNGLVVVDEAYIDFASYKSLIPNLVKYPNLVILQTFSKAWGLAGIRLGAAFASKEIVGLLTKIKPPYNINAVSQKLALDALSLSEEVTKTTKILISERNKLKEVLERLPFVQKVYPSEANFLLVKMNDAKSVYDYLVVNKISVRNRSEVNLCEGCLRITIGSEDENILLITHLKNYL